MIKSGVYKKALKAVYEKENAEKDADSITKSGSTDSEEKLSSLKSDATKLYKSADALKKVDCDSVSEDDLVSKVKSFVNDYNSTINATKNLNSYGILQTAVWTTEQAGYSEGLLNKVGISIGDDNTLKVDEEALKSADKATLKTLFSGAGSFADRIYFQRKECDRNYITYNISPHAFYQVNPVQTEKLYRTVLGYAVKKIQPVDMFPMTSGVETVCLLSNTGK